MSATKAVFDLFKSPYAMEDPGASKPIRVDRQLAVVPIKTAAAEARTLTQPTKAGLTCTVVLRTDGGDLTLTVTGGYNQAAATTLTFAEAGDFVTFRSIQVGSLYYWRIVEYEGVAVTEASLSATSLTATNLSATSLSASALVSPGTRSVVASTTLTAADSGKTIVVNTTGDCILTLPPTAAGLKYDIFILQAAGSGKLHSISPNSADKLIGSGITATDNKDLQNTQATAAVGDCVSLEADAADGWLVKNVTGTWARET